MPSETESCSNPLVWPITRMCLRWTCFSCGGGGSEGSPAGSFWAAIKAARTGSKKKSNGAIRAGRKRSPSKHSFRDTVWHEGTLIGVLRCRRTLKVTQGTPRGLASLCPCLALSQAIAQSLFGRGLTTFTTVSSESKIQPFQKRPRDRITRYTLSRPQLASASPQSRDRGAGGRCRNFAVRMHQNEDDGKPINRLQGE